MKQVNFNRQTLSGNGETLMGLIFQPELASEQPLATRLFDNAISKNHLANAYLLVGDNDEAKFEIANQIACFLNCQSHKDSSCLSANNAPDALCQNCSWINEGNHPQAWLLLSAGDGSKIPVEAARLLKEEFTKTSGFKRVAVVDNASSDVFHRPSANALLKTIEEPRGNGLFFFFARDPEVVLTTIVSRCQVIPVASPASLLAGPVYKITTDRSFKPTGKFEKDHAEISEVIVSLKDLSFFGWAEELINGKVKSKFGYGQSLALARALLDFCTKLDDPELVIDVAYMTELEIIGSYAQDSPIVTDYLNQLLRLCEEAKSRVARYVGKKACFESFAFKWSQIRGEFTG